MDIPVLADQQTLPFINSVWTLDDIQVLLMGMDGERKSKESMLSMHLDDDDIVEEKMFWHHSTTAVVFAKPYCSWLVGYFMAYKSLWVI